MKYIINYGYNKLESNSRNAKKWAQDLGQDVTITTKKGKVVSRAMIDANGNVYSVAVD